MEHGSIGYALIVVSVMVTLAGFFVGGESAEERIGKRCQSVPDTAFATQVSSGIDQHWTCGGHNPTEVGRELKEEIKPQACNEDGGAAYLGTKEHLFIVSHQTPGTGVEGTYLITRGSLNGHYSGGHFICLGPGFGPPTPPNGLGGSVGSFGGAK